MKKIHVLIVEDYEGDMNLTKSMDMNSIKGILDAVNPF